MTWKSKWNWEATGTKNRLRELYQSGVAVKSIAYEFGVSLNTIIRHCRALGLSRRRPAHSDQKTPFAFKASPKLAEAIKAEAGRRKISYARFIRAAVIQSLKESVNEMGTNARRSLHNDL